MSFITDLVDSIPGVNNITDMLGLTGKAGGSEQQSSLDAWKKLLANANVQYQAPQDTFDQQQGALGQLKQQSQTGLTPQDIYGFWQARQQGADLAKQGQGAAQQQAAMQGGGVANTGQNAVMQGAAAQAGANRAQQGDLAQAGASSARKYQATLNYLQGLQGLGNQQFRNASALNQFNQQNFGNQAMATGGVSGGYQNMANWQQQQQEQRRQAGQGLFNMIAPGIFPQKKQGYGLDTNSAWQGINDAGGLPGIGTGI